MIEIEGLIRLLAEAPAEDAPMTRPKELLDRVAIERVAQEGVVQPGPAVPNAKVNTAQTVTGARPEPNPSPQVSGVPSKFNFRQPSSGPTANPIQQIQSEGQTAKATQSQRTTGATADPKTGMPSMDMPVKVMAPETFMGRVATPKILEAIAGMPAERRQRETVVGVASPSPKTQVTISVPPAFPIDPKEAFSIVDEQLELPPRQDRINPREIRANLDDLQLESTEAFVARSYQNNEGASSELDRYYL